MKKLIVTLSLFCLYWTASALNGRAAILQVGTNWVGSPHPDIQSAVYAASDGDELWIEQGTYVLTNTLVIDKSISLYGGFIGSETIRTERVWSSQITTVDGNDAVRCFHVANTNFAAVRIDGLSITKGLTGNENGAGIWNGNFTGSITGILEVANCDFLLNNSGKHAGGIYNDVGFLTITNSTFTQNTATNRGGAICNYAQSPGITLTLVDCLFDRNSAANAGAIYAANNAGTTNVITGCTLTGNQANPSGSGDGGAILCDASLIVSKCIFDQNAAGRSGGVLGARGDTGRSATFSNCLFIRNSALNGAAICINGSSGPLGVVSAVNCTFADNTLKFGGKGSALYTSKPTNDVNSVFDIVNCILWGNATNAIDRSGTTQPLPTVSYSDIDQDGYAGSNGNLNQNPLFVSTASTNYHLQDASPCINAGTSTGAPVEDLDGLARPQGIRFDMGAYEVATPLIATLSATNVTADSATLTCQVTSTGGAPTTVYASWNERSVSTSPIDADTYIDSFNSNKNYGASGSAKVVASSTPSRTLFTLPASLWTNEVSNIVSATVSFYVWNDSTGSQDMRLYPLTRGFVEGTNNGTTPANGATWNTFDGTNTWTTPGGDFDASTSVLAVKGIAGVYSNDPNGKFFTWDIAPLLTNSTTRAELQTFGALLDAGTVSPQKFASFNSSDKTGYPQAYLPSLTVILSTDEPEQSDSLGLCSTGTLSHTVSNLNPNTYYSFTFMASNAASVVWSSTESSFTTLLATVATPRFSPDGGAFTSATFSVTVTCATASATLRYTTDGSEPSETNSIVVSGGTVSVPVPGTLKAKAWKDGMYASSTKTATYVSYQAWENGFEDLGGGWRRLAWLGDYVPMGTEGWVWHNQHGFFYVAANSIPNSIWLFTSDMGWLWTEDTVYPFLYRNNDSSWLWYNGATNPRWFMNFSNSQWESRP